MVFKTCQIEIFCFLVKVFSVQHKCNFSASFPCHGKFERLLSAQKLIFRVGPISELNHLKMSYLFAKFHACITKGTILVNFGLSSWTMRINMRGARYGTPGMRIPLLGGYRPSTKD